MYCPSAIATAARGMGSSRPLGRIGFLESGGGRHMHVNTSAASSMMEEWSGSITMHARMDGSSMDGGIEQLLLPAVADGCGLLLRASSCCQYSRATDC
jgi:hypothetical protein